MTELPELLFITAGLLAINASIAGVLWWRYRTPLYRALFLIWPAFMVSMLAQGAVQSERYTHLAFGCAGAAVNSALADLVRRALGLSGAWRWYLAAFAALFTVSVAATVLGAPFWVKAMPMAIAAPLPLFHMLWQALTRPHRPRSATANATLFAVGFVALHHLDYPFLRMDPQFASLGFMLAILALFGVSITAPAAVHERLAAEVSRLQDEVVVRARLSVLGEAAAMLAHEVRNPLGAITNVIELLRKEPGLSTQGKGLLAVQESEVGRINRLVQDLLHFTRPPSGPKRRVDVVEALRVAMDGVRSYAGEAGVKLVGELEGQPVVVEGDFDHLVGAFSNLLRNAVEASPRGGEVKASMARSHKEARFAVMDQGPGIREEHAERLFEPFFTTRATGTGLGLAIVSRVAKEHGGTITASNGEKGGAVFTLVLPIEGAEARARDS